MPASALLKFTQGVTVGGDGRALVGVLSTSVALSNVSNTSVASWQIEIAYADPTSSLAASPTIYAFNENSSTPAANFVPDVRRSYRWVLKVWSVPNRVGDPDSIDIRVFSVRELNGLIIPPAQIWPLPLPDPRTGDPTAKPLEMNFDGQLHGWHGTGVDGLLSDVLARHVLPVPGNPGDVATVVGGRWVSQAPAGGGSGDITGPGASVDGNIVLWDGTAGDKIKDAGISLSAFIRKDGTVPFTGSQSMGGFKLTDLASGTLSTDAVTYGQLQSAINGLDPKGNVRAYSTSNEALNGLGALGGVASFTDGQRVGLGGQTNPTENGIWVKHSGAWTRPSDFAVGMDVSGAYFIVEEGTFADREFLVTSDAGAAVVGTNNLTLQDFGSSTVSAGNGLSKTGNVLAVVADGGTLTVSGTGVKVSAGGITGTELATGAVDLSTTKVTGLLPFANIANGSAASLFGRSANSVGVMASIASSADGQVLRRAAGVLGFGAVDLADTDAVTGLLPYANLASLAALSVLGRGGNTLGVMAAITGTADQVLAVNTAGTALAFGLVQTGGIANSAVTLAKLANGTAASVLGRSAATGGAYADIASSADGQVFRRAAGVLGWGAIDLADADAVSGLLAFANFADGAATSVFARASGTSGVMASLAASADGQILQRVAGALTWTTVSVGTLGGGSAVGQVLINTVGNVPAWGAVDLADTDAVTGLLPFANFANGAANSVFGRAAGSIGVMASIAASADGQVLRMAAGSVGFGAVDLADADAITGLLPFANIASLAALSVLGRSGNTLGVMAAITGTADQVLVVNGAGTALSFGTIATNGLGNGSVTLAKLANATASSVLGRSAASTGAYADIVSSADGQVLRRGASGVIAWGAIDLSDTDAVSNQLAGSFVVPNFVAQNISTTGDFLLGTTVANAGDFRVNHGFSMAGRNLANGADVQLIRWGALVNNTLTIGEATAGYNTQVVGDAVSANSLQTIVISVASVAQLTIATNLVTVPGAIKIGTTTAANGNIRLENGGIVRARNFANNADLDMLTTGSGDQIILGNSSDCSVLLTSQNVLLRPAGTDRVQVTDTVFEWRLATVRFDVAIASPTITIEPDATAAATGKPLTIAGHDVTGTGSTVGGLTTLRAGNSSNGTGGVLDLRSGSGVTNGSFTARIGGTIFMSWSGAAAVASTGALRLASTTGIYARKNDNSADISLLVTNSGDTVFVGDLVTSPSVVLQTSGARLILGTSVEIQNSQQFRFDNAITGGVSIIHEADTTNGSALANKFTIAAQNRTGTGATVGAELELASGTGATAGNFTIKRGAVVVLQWNAGTPASDFMQFGGTPATSGVIRLSHAMTVAGMNNAGSVSAALLRWGVTANDTVTLGNTTFNTEILGAAVSIGDGSSYLELAVLATNREILAIMLGTALTTSEMPANTGDKVAFWAYSTTLALANPVGGYIFECDSTGFYIRSANGNITQIAAN